MEYFSCFALIKYDTGVLFLRKFLSAYGELVGVWSLRSSFRSLTHAHFFSPARFCMQAVNAGQ